MAPEVLRTEGGSDKSDVYSYGVVLWEVLTGEAAVPELHFQNGLACMRASFKAQVVRPSVCLHAKLHF